MSLRVFTDTKDPKKIYYGSTELKSVWWGSQKVWPMAKFYIINGSTTEIINWTDSSAGSCASNRTHYIHLRASKDDKICAVKFSCSSSGDNSVFVSKAWMANSSQSDTTLKSSTATYSGTSSSGVLRPTSGSLLSTTSTYNDDDATFDWLIEVTIKPNTSLKEVTLTVKLEDIYDPDDGNLCECDSLTSTYTQHADKIIWNSDYSSDGCISSTVGTTISLYSNAACTTALDLTSLTISSQSKDVYIKVSTTRESGTEYLYSKNGVFYLSMSSPSLALSTSSTTVFTITSQPSETSTNGVWKAQITVNSNASSWTNGELTLSKSTAAKTGETITATVTNATYNATSSRSATLTCTFSYKIGTTTKTETKTTTVSQVADPSRTATYSTAVTSGASISNSTTLSPTITVATNVPSPTVSVTSSSISNGSSAGTTATFSVTITSSESSKSLTWSGGGTNIYYTNSSNNPTSTTSNSASAGLTCKSNSGSWGTVSFSASSESDLSASGWTKTYGSVMSCSFTGTSSRSETFKCTVSVSKTNASRTITVTTTFKDGTSTINTATATITQEASDEVTKTAETSQTWTQNGESDTTATDYSISSDSTWATVSEKTVTLSANGSYPSLDSCSVTRSHTSFTCDSTPTVTFTATPSFTSGTSGTANRTATLTFTLAKNTTRNVTLTAQTKTITLKQKSIDGSNITPSCTYQWYLNDTSAISNATSSQYSVRPFTTTNCSSTTYTMDDPTSSLTIAAAKNSTKTVTSPRSWYYNNGTNARNSDSYYCRLNPSGSTTGSECSDYWYVTQNGTSKIDTTYITVTPSISDTTYFSISPSTGSTSAQTITVKALYSNEGSTTAAPSIDTPSANASASATTYTITGSFDYAYSSDSSSQSSTGKVTINTNLPGAGTYTFNSISIGSFTSPVVCSTSTSTLSSTTVTYNYTYTRSSKSSRTITVYAGKSSSVRTATLTFTDSRSKQKTVSITQSGSESWTSTSLTQSGVEAVNTTTTETQSLKNTTYEMSGSGYSLFNASTGTLTWSESNTDTSNSQTAKLTVTAKSSKTSTEKSTSASVTRSASVWQSGGIAEV